MTFWIVCGGIALGTAVFVVGFMLGREWERVDRDLEQRGQ